MSLIKYIKNYEKFFNNIVGRYSEEQVKSVFDAIGRGDVDVLYELLKKLRDKGEIYWDQLVLNQKSALEMSCLSPSSGVMTWHC